MIRMITATAFLLPLAMGGCATSSLKGMREGKPVLIADSARDPMSITSCVSETWVANGLTPKSVPRTNGATVLIEVAIYNTPFMFVDADATPSGSHVTMHLLKAVWAKQNRRRIDEVRACL